jgi:hypothetical protein
MEKQIMNLGYVNGMTSEQMDNLRELKRRAIPDTLKHEEKFNCDHRYEFDVEINGEIVTVKYAVDSGD